MKIIITGATGMVGSIVLKHCIDSPQISEIVSITRRPCGISHEKLTELIPTSFTDYAGQESHFQNISAAYFCLGAYTGAVSDDVFKTITVVQS